MPDYDIIDLLHELWHLISSPIVMKFKPPKSSVAIQIQGKIRDLCINAAAYDNGEKMNVQILRMFEKYIQNTLRFQFNNFHDQEILERMLKIWVEYKAKVDCLDMLFKSFNDEVLIQNGCNNVYRDHLYTSVKGVGRILFVSLLLENKGLCEKLVANVVLHISKRDNSGFFDITTLDSIKEMIVDCDTENSTSLYKAIFSDILPQAELINISSLSM
uniref:Cullin domain-containing protein n=1 Tax=Rhabditophanes sp. KR3021 TaxID=114890 RepID=A0AC35U417_9BILA